MVYYVRFSAHLACLRLRYSPISCPIPPVLVTADVNCEPTLSITKHIQPNQITMKSLILLSALLPLAIATPLSPTVPDSGLPIEPKLPPRACNKICAPSAESLDCGKGWSPYDFGGGVSITFF